MNKHKHISLKKCYTFVLFYNSTELEESKEKNTATG